MACRVRDHSIWTNRLLLESCLYPASSFLTLTYAEAPWQLVPRHLQLFMKRLRYYVDKPLRFFGVGEYGERTGRPHYHLAVFGLQTLPGPIREGPVLDAWQYGFAFGGTLQKESAAYIAGYVTKKWTRPDRHTDVPEKLAGRHPEFSRMSNRPGIGAVAADRLGSFYTSKVGAAELAFHRDVKAVFRSNGKVRQVGRYLHNRMRDIAGIDDDMKGVNYWDEVHARMDVAASVNHTDLMAQFFAQRDGLARASLTSWKRVERSL